MYGYLFLFLAIPSFVGGYITCWIAVNKKITTALLMSFLGFIILLSIGIANTGFHWATTFASLTIIPFAIMGAIVRRIIENKRKDAIY